jgi:hypothetical protein
LLFGNWFLGIRHVASPQEVARRRG